jgi:hypothetical protein
MAISVQHKRGTRSQLDTAAGSSGLKVGELYYITDEFRIAVGLTTSTYGLVQPVLKKSQSNLTIDGSTGNTFDISLSGNASFSLSNIAKDLYYLFVITASATLTVTLPNTADKYASQTVDLESGDTVEISLRYDGTTRYWQISEVLS